MKLVHLAGFVALAEELHFGRAGRRVGVGQSALSRQMQALEDDLGVELLVRSARRVELTAAGRALLSHARACLAEAEAGARAARYAGGGSDMGLRVGHADWTEQLLPPVLRTLRRRCPGTELAVSPVERPEQAARLRNWGIDIAVSRTPADEPDLDCQVLLEEPMVVALSADHPLAKHERIEVGRLSALPFVLFPPELCPCAHQLVNDLCRQAGFTPAVVTEAPALSSVILAVASGVGVSMVPASSALRLRTRDIVYRPLGGADIPGLPLVAVWRSADRSRPVQEFLKAARALHVADVA
jgi:DNA-binding transcriptional LysR family regulator